MKIIKILLFIVVILLQISIATAMETGQYLYTIDGDTVYILINNQKEKVRLIGIDCPETKENNRLYYQMKKFGLSKNELISRGINAKQFTQNFLTGQKQIEIEFDIEKRDQYGRLLAYLWVDEKMLNQELIKQGHAWPYPYKPNTKYAKILNQRY